MTRWFSAAVTLSFWLLLIHGHVVTAQDEHHQQQQQQQHVEQQQQQQQQQHQEQPECLNPQTLADVQHELQQCHVNMDTRLRQLEDSLQQEKTREVERLQTIHQEELQRLLQDHQQTTQQQHQQALEQSLEQQRRALEQQHQQAIQQQLDQVRHSHDAARKQDQSVLQTAQIELSQTKEIVRLYQAKWYRRWIVWPLARHVGTPVQALAQDFYDVWPPAWQEVWQAHITPVWNQVADLWVNTIVPTIEDGLERVLELLEQLGSWCVTQLVKAWTWAWPHVRDAAWWVGGVLQQAYERVHEWYQTHYLPWWQTNLEPTWHKVQQAWHEHVYEPLSEFWATSIVPFWETNVWPLLVQAAKSARHGALVAYQALGGVLHQGALAVQPFIEDTFRLPMGWAVRGTKNMSEEPETSFGVVLWVPLAVVAWYTWRLVKFVFGWMFGRRNSNKKDTDEKHVKFANGNPSTPKAKHEKAQRRGTPHPKKKQ